MAALLAAVGLIVGTVSVFPVGTSVVHASLTFVNRTTSNGLAANGIRTTVADGQNLYAGTSAGLSISSNGGQSFVTRTTADGLGGNAIDGIWASGSTIYAATGNGLSVSTDGGQVFTNDNLGGGNNAAVKSVSRVGQNVYVATVAGLNVSTNGGQSFTLLDSRAFGGTASDAFLTDVQAIGSTVYASVYYLNNFGAPGGIFKSINGGTTFTNTGAPNGNWINVFVDGTNVYATDSSNALYVSTNSGTSFTQWTIPGPISALNNVWASGSTVYISTDGGLYASSDGGQNFTLYTTSNGLGANTVYGGIASNGSSVFVGTTAGLSIGSLPVPTVSAVSPASGAEGGGTVITIAGTNFAAGTTVTVGGATCTNVTVVSTTSITCTTPAGSAGTASVIVTSGGLLNSANTLFTYVAPTVVPSTQTMSGTTGTAVTASTAFTPANFTGSVTYAVTNGTLPAGLSLSSTTGVVSGTPTAASTATVTITASGATAGTATATITFAIAAAATPTPAPAAPTTTVAPAVTTPAVTTPTILPDAPQLVTSENQALLESAPGEATAIVNGKAVAVETIKVEATATTKELEATGQNIVNILSALTPSGSVNPVKLVKTSDGPVLTGLIVNPYDSTEKLDAPVESVTLVKAGESAVLISALNITNLPAPVAASGSIEVTRGGVLAARSYGLPSLETGEIVLMSTPRLLQKFTVDKDGSFSGQVALPRDVALGSHTVVMATKNVKVSLGITLVATKLMFRVKSTIGTRLFEKRAGVKKVGGAVTVTGAGRCKAKLGKITMNKKPGKCFITVKQAAQGSNRAIFSRFTVTVVKKLPKAKKR